MRRPHVRQSENVPRRLSRRIPGAAAVRAGFTLMEVMLATAILTIGLASIVALFPVAIDVGRQVIESSNAVVIGQSVAESIRDGIRNRKRFITSRNGNTDVYFIFEHDGITDRIPASFDRESPRHDYFILLPRHPRGKAYPGATALDRRFLAVEASKTFLYPETDEPPNGGGDASRALDDARKQSVEDIFDLRVEKVYELGQELYPESRPSSERLADIEKEVLKQYSFAFAITPSYFDADLSEVRGNFEPANALYHVHVMVFRQFLEPSPHTLPSKPVYELHFEVAP